MHACIDQEYTPMKALPVIVGFGGYNAAGRSSSHQAFRRIVLESLTKQEQQQTIVGLACLMNLVSWDGQFYSDAKNSQLTSKQVVKTFGDLVIKGTLIRRLEDSLFNPKKVYGHKKVKIEPQDGKTVVFKLAKSEPDPGSE